MSHADECPDGPEWSGEFDTPPPPQSPAAPITPAGQTIATRVQPHPAPDPPAAAALPHVPGYELTAELGRGGMGVVYRATQLALGRTVALKMLRDEPGGSSSLAGRFRVEAEAAARLEHPNIVRVYEVGSDAGRPYLVMEWVNGGSLAARLAAAPLTPRAAAAVVAALARAADHAHRHGVVHRDLKPANVLLDGAADDLETAVRAGRVTPKLADFGLAKRLDGDDGTLPGAVLGTPSYMAPEQADGRSKHAGPAVDVYALGAVLYECLTGRPPFRAATPLETLDQVRRGDPIPPSRFRHALPRDLQTICLKCLEKNPARRYTSAAELADDLDRFGDGRPVQARPVGPVARAVRWAKRRPTAAGLLAACLLVAAGGLAGLATHNARLQEEVQRTRKQEAETRRQKATALDHVRKGHAALDDIFTSLDNAPVGAHGTTAFQSVYDDQAQAILRFYHDVLRDGDAADPEVRFTRGMVSVYAGRMHQRLGNPTEAETDFLRGRDLLAPLATAADAPHDHRREWAQCCYWLGTLYLSTGRVEQARELLGRAAKTAAGLEAEGAVGHRDRRVAALAHTRLVYTERIAGVPDVAVRHASDALARWDHLITGDPADEINRSWAVIALTELAYTHWITRKWPDLDALALRSEAARVWYAAHPPRRVAGLTGRSYLGEVYRLTAHGHIARGDTPAAAARLTDGIRLLDDALRADPTFAAGRQRGAMLYRDRAFFVGGAGAAADWDRAIALADNADALGYRIERANARFETGESVADELAVLAADAGLTAAQAAELGRAYARAADRDPALAANAVACVRRAVEGRHFKDAAAFKGYAADAVFADIRGRADFAELTARVK